MPLAADLRRDLNPAQVAAVEQVDGPVLVFAGAGSGKTRVITYRTAHLVAGLGVPPWRVMCVTFTNKAAGEMKERCVSLLGAATARQLWISTFHSTGARLLRRYHEQSGLARDFAIYDESDTRAVITRVYADLNVDDTQLNPRAALGLIDRFKQEVRSPAQVADAARSDFEGRVAEIYANYEHRLKAANAVDFGDLLKRVVELLESDVTVRTELQQRFRYVMIDEFQDTNAAQYRIVRALVGPERNICVVGDDDQAIYRWRGADVRNIANFKRDFPDAAVILLEQNYRSTGRILRAANAVVQRLHTRERKVLFTHNDDGPYVAVIHARDEREEAMQVAHRIRAANGRGAALRDHAVFYRIHAQSRPLEEAMRAANLPYVIVGGMRFYERAEIKDTLSYLRMLVNPQDDVSFLRVVNQPPRGIGKTTLDRLTVHARSRGTSLWAVLADGELPADIGSARKRLSDFRGLIVELQRETATMRERPADLTSHVLDRTGYIEMMRADPEPEAESRRQNVQELIGSMLQYAQQEETPTLSGYLERVTLEDVGAREGDGKADRVSLMTVHSAKGLEFDTVFVTGLEERMFPYRGVEPGADHEELEEERRLAYVAITRARRQLVLSRAAFRQIFGTTRAEPPSRFLDEIPAEVLSAPPVSRPPPAPSRSEGPRVVYDDPVKPEHEVLGGSYRRGMRVKHPKFGIGRVESVEPGAELKLTVYFPGIGASKKLLAEFVNPV